eukprot:scaffold18099_cov112-Isochrysis_galbana.AAC.6
MRGTAAPATGRSRSATTLKKPVRLKMPRHRGVGLGIDPIYPSVNAPPAQCIRLERGVREGAY